MPLIHEMVDVVFIWKYFRCFSVELFPIFLNLDPCIHGGIFTLINPRHLLLVTEAVSN